MASLIETRLKSIIPDCTVYSCYHLPIPVIQQTAGTCGLISILMIFNHLYHVVSSESDSEGHLLHLARRLGTTISGELFSIDEYALTLKEYFKEKNVSPTVVISNTQDVSKRKIVDWIANGGMISIAYDKDVQENKI